MIKVGKPEQTEDTFYLYLEQQSDKKIALMARVGGSVYNIANFSEKGGRLDECRGKCLPMDKFHVDVHGQITLGF